MRYCQYSYAALMVPGRCTNGTRPLHFSGTVFLKLLQTWSIDVSGLFV